MGAMVVSRETLEPEAEQEVADVRRVEGIWDSYQPTVLRFFGRRPCSPEVAEDLTQQVFIRVWKNRDKLHSIQSLPSWLKTIASRVWQNHLRDRKAAKRGAPTMSLDKHLLEAGEVAIDSVDGAGAEDPAQRAAARMEIEAVKQDLATLPPKQRQVLRLVGFQGFSNRQAARVLGITVNTVKSHVSQGRRRLRHLQEERAQGGAS